MIKVFGSKVGQEELDQVAESVNHQWLGSGPKVKEFEAMFQSKVATPNFLMIDNASNGLYLALTLLNLPKGSEVILPSFTWIACAHSVVMAGCKPIFCDVEYDTQNISARLIEQHITEKTKAIMVVHYAGLPCDMTPILEFGLPIIEDAAHAVNSIYKGSHCGTIGEFGAFSFDSMKNIAVGEGGGLACKNPENLERARRMRLCGMGASAHQYANSGNNNRWWEQEANEIFIKMNPSDVIAGFALAQLRKLSVLQNKRKEVWDFYQKELNGIGDLVLPVSVDDSEEFQHSYFTFLLKTTKRDQLAKFLLDKDIYSTLRFFPIHLNKIYNTGDKLPNTELLNGNGLNIPLHPNLSDSEIEHVVNQIRHFFN